MVGQGVGGTKRGVEMGREVPDRLRSRNGVCVGGGGCSRVYDGRDVDVGLDEEKSDKA